MNATKKTLLAVSILAATGAANAAAVATYDVALTPIDVMYNFPQSTDTLTGEVTPAHVGNILDTTASGLGGVGTAILDDSGTLTITGTSRTKTTLGTDTVLGSIYTLSGTWNGTTFSASSGSFKYTSCADAPGALITCDRIPLNFSIPVTGGVTGSATVSDGSFIATQISNTSTKHDSFVLSNGTPAVPVPAAAWLFGSGLFSLIGAARRRRAA